MKLHSGPLPVVAILAFDSAINLYAESLRFVAWKLRKIGCKVICAGCEKTLRTCTSFNALGNIEPTQSERDTVCGRCAKAQLKLSSDGVVSLSEDDQVALDDASPFLAGMMQRLKLRRRVSDVLDMEYAGFPICRTAFFDFAITTKLHVGSDLSPSSMRRFILGVEDQIKILHFLERLYARHALTHVVYINGNYSQNTLVRQFFTKYGISSLSIEPQLTSQSILSKVMFVRDRLPLEPEGLHRKLSAPDCRESLSVIGAARVLKNFGARIGGAEFNAYTTLDRSKIPNEEIRRLSVFLREHSRIHTYFLSSEDELTPHVYTHGALNGGDLNSKGPFNSQLEFMVYLLAEAAKFPQIGFVVRMHPRMAVNKRDSFESEEHLRYKSILTSSMLPNNVMVIYGDSKISSYCLIHKSDTVIVSWSTIGLEAMLLGVPVVSVFPGCLMYPLESFSKQPSTWAEFENALFMQSNYGKPEDQKLLGWVGQAYENQFFVTAAPRGTGRLLGRLYNYCYRALDKIGMYSALATVINCVTQHAVEFDREYLFVKRPHNCLMPGLSMYFCSWLLSRYRAKYHTVLTGYLSS